ncbi:MAG: hypothetical protein FWH28_00930 [Clostridiales bacterium]|nr:hypothetical protein [Clostridiales bacterium]
MRFTELYQAKKCSPEEAISVIQSGDRVYASGDTVVLFQALYDTRENFRDVDLYTQFRLNGKADELILHPDMVGHLTFITTTLALSSAQNPWPRENLDQLPLSFSWMERMIEERIKPDVVLSSATPMDDDGFFFLGTRHGTTRTAMDMGAKIVLQVNEDMCKVNTDYYRVHISEVYALCEAKNPEERMAGEPREIGEKEAQVAAYIVDRITDGATIQLGAGGVSNAVGKFLGGHKNLGLHAETIMESLYPLLQNGVINNSRKPLLRGISVAGFFGTNASNFKFFHNNPDFMVKRLSWVNSPLTVSQIPNMVSVNACLGVDLRGQVCSESLAMGNTGGVGGQLDFVEGARRAPGGQSFLVMHSSVTTRSGEKVSKITLTLPAGSVVTTPASEVMNVVTEYGIAELYRKSARERARSLIAIADPEFRDSLAFDAKKYGLL